MAYKKNYRNVSKQGCNENVVLISKKVQLDHKCILFNCLLGFTEEFKLY